MGKSAVGFGKANEVSEAIRKASEAARKSMEKVSLRENTIPHEVIGEFDGARVLLRPASPGTGVIAGAVYVLWPKRPAFATCWRSHSAQVITLM